jgi:ketosteroid isomerase-like protein
MSQENVEIVRRAFAAYEREGLQGLLACLHPEIEWTTTGMFLDADTYRGHDDVRRYLGLFDEFEDLRNEPIELIDAGEQVVVCSRVSGRGTRSGAAVDLMLYSVGSIRDGKIGRLHNYRTKAEALEAAGLSEEGRSRLRRSRLD